MFYLSAIIIMILDQLIKYFISAHFLPGQSVPIIGNVLHLTYVQNRGAAFGILSGFETFLLIIGIVAVAIIFYFHSSFKARDFVQLPLGLILGGSFGNIIDRFLRHYVVDYIDFRVWPVFNLADVMINVGVALLMWYWFFSGEDKNASSTS